MRKQTYRANRKSVPRWETLWPNFLFLPANLHLIFHRRAVLNAFFNMCVWICLGNHQADPSLFSTQSLQHAVEATVSCESSFKNFGISGKLTCDQKRKNGNKMVENVNLHLLQQIISVQNTKWGRN